MWRKLDRDLALLYELLNHSRTQSFIYSDIADSASVLASAHIPRRLHREAVRIRDCRSAVHRISKAPSQIKRIACNHICSAQGWIGSRSPYVTQPEESDELLLLAHYVDPKLLIQARLLQELCRSARSNLLGTTPHHSPLVLLLQLDELDPVHPNLRLTHPSSGSSEKARLAAARLLKREVTHAVIACAATTIIVLLGCAAFVLPMNWTGVLLLTLALSTLAHGVSSEFRELLLGIPSRPRARVLPAPDPVCIAIPVLLGSNVQIIDLLSTVHQNASRDLNSCFVLLTDHQDSITGKDSPTEQRLLTTLVEGLERLSTVHGARFYLLHRDRSFSLVQNAYIGRERKRGKIDALNRYMMGERVEEFSFTWGDVSALTSHEYVFVIDEDTMIYSQTARTLLAHCVSSKARGSESPGQAHIFCPASFVRFASGHRATWLARTFAAVTPKERSLSSDLFAESLYSGKGLYRVADYVTAVAGKLPDDRVLSHDTIEGSWLRPQFVAEAIISELFPSDYARFLARNHRWARGDTQNAVLLLMQVLKRMSAPFGPSLATKSYLLFTVLTRATVASTPFLLLTAFSDEFDEWWKPVAVIVTILLAPIFASATLNIIRNRTAASITPVSLLIRMRSAIMRSAILAAMAMSRSASAISAVCLAIFAMASSRRTLSWTPSSHAGAAVRWASFITEAAAPSTYCLLLWGHLTTGQTILILLWLLWQCGMLVFLRRLGSD